jgi:ATP adenylyltransferase
MFSNSEEKHVDVRSARKGPYRDLVKKISSDGVCPFCPEHFNKYHPKPVLKRSGGWLITENIKPYPNAAFHFLLVSTKHLTSIAEMTSTDWQCIQELIHWAEEEYKIEGAAFAMRYGSSRFTGASVTHLHAHLIVADATRKRSAWELILARVFKKSQAVEFPIGRREGYK